MPHACLNFAGLIRRAGPRQSQAPLYIPRYQDTAPFSVPGCNLLADIASQRFQNAYLRFRHPPAQCETCRIAIITSRRVSRLSGGEADLGGNITRTYPASDDGMRMSIQNTFQITNL